MSLIEDVIKGHIENRIAELKAHYAQSGNKDTFILFSAPIGLALGVSRFAVERVMEKFAVELGLVKKWSYSCAKTELPLKTTKKPIEKAYCMYCCKKHNKDRETLDESINYWVEVGKDEKQKELIRG